MFAVLLHKNEFNVTDKSCSQNTINNKRSKISDKHVTIKPTVTLASFYIKIAWQMSVNVCYMKATRVTSYECPQDCSYSTTWLLTWPIQRLHMVQATLILWYFITGVSHIIKYKISPIRDWRSTPTYCQLQSHARQKLGRNSKIRPK